MSKALPSDGSSRSDRTGRAVELTGDQWELVLDALVYFQQNTTVNSEEDRPLFDCFDEIERQLEAVP